MYYGINVWATLLKRFLIDWLKMEPRTSNSMMQVFVLIVLKEIHKNQERTYKLQATTSRNHSLKCLWSFPTHTFNSRCYFIPFIARFGYMN